jgi:hypothetical protein
MPANPREGRRVQAQALKQEALESLQRLPEDADIDEIMYLLYVIDKLRKSHDAAERGEIISHDNLLRQIEQHKSKSSAAKN